MYMYMRLAFMFRALLRHCWGSALSPDVDNLDTQCINRIFRPKYLANIDLSIALLLFCITYEKPCPTTDSPISVQPGPSSTTHRHVVQLREERQGRH